MAAERAKEEQRRKEVEVRFNVGFVFVTLMFIFKLFFKFVTLLFLVVIIQGSFARSREIVRRRTRRVTQASRRFSCASHRPRQTATGQIRASLSDFHYFIDYLHLTGRTREIACRTRSATQSKQFFYLKHYAHKNENS